jgi:LacI family transcriptional regulator
MKGKPITIEDVAVAAEVSRQTVSRVINAHPNVKDAVRKRVEAAIVDLGYIPNLSARRMGGARSYLIVAINDRQRTIENWQAGRGNDWVDQMLCGGMTECEKHQYNFLFQLVDTDPDLAVEGLARRIGSIRPDGVILTPPHCDNERLVALLSDRGVSCARVGHRGGTDTVDVFMDEEGAAHALTSMLIGMGHRRVAFIAGGANYRNSTLRVDGFRRALAEAGIPQDGGAVGTGDFNFNVASPVVRELLDRPQPPTAIIADNDEMAFAALHVANERGLAVPDSLSIVSFEDTPGVRFSFPPLTAIRQPTAEMIALACEKLIAIAGGKDGLGSFELPYEIKVRASTAGPPE